MLQYITQYRSEYYLSHSNFLLLQYVKSSPLPATDAMFGKEMVLLILKTKICIYELSPFC